MTAGPSPSSSTAMRSISVKRHRLRPLRSDSRSRRCRRSRCAPRRRDGATAAGSAHADAGRRAGGDHVAGKERDAARAGLDQGRDVVDQVLGRAVLAKRAVDPAADPRRAAVELVGGDDPRTHRAEGVEALAEVPLLMAHLHVTRGDVVDDRVAEDMVHRPRARDVAAAAPDHDRELGFVVDLARRRGAGQADGVMRADDALGELAEDDRPGVALRACSRETGAGELGAWAW